MRRALWPGPDDHPGETAAFFDAGRGPAVVFVADREGGVGEEVAGVNRRGGRRTRSRISRGGVRWRSGGVGSGEVRGRGGSEITS